MVEYCDSLSVTETIDSAVNSHTTISGDTFEINTANENKAAIVEERHSSSTLQGHSMRDKFCASLSFLCLIIVVVGVILIPIILYYTNPSSNSFSVSGIVDLESCSVSYNIECLLLHYKALHTSMHN